MREKSHDHIQHMNTIHSCCLFEGLFCILNIFELFHKNRKNFGYSRIGRCNFGFGSSIKNVCPVPVLSSLLSLLTHISRPNNTKNSLLVALGKKLTSVDGGGGAWVISFNVLFSCCFKRSFLARFFSYEAAVVCTDTKNITSLDDNNTVIISKIRYHAVKNR